MSFTRDTSREAYDSLDNLGERQHQVFETIAHLGEACNIEIAQFLRLPINAITPRTNELVKAGMVVEAGKRVTPITGRRVIYWKARPRGEEHRPVFGDTQWIHQARKAMPRETE